jgi:uncharacterized protein DUF4386
MMERLAGAAPRLQARIAGVLYLIIFIAGPFAEFFVRDPLVVYRDAAATATNILAHESLYRSGGAATLITVACEPAVALLFYELLYAQGLWMTLIFFGSHCLLLGYLIYKAAFLHRILGVMMAIAGLCYVIHSFARLVAPIFGARLFPYMIVPGFVAELALTLWLLVFGVNAQRWKEQATAAADLK